MKQLDRCNRPRKDSLVVKTLKHTTCCEQKLVYSYLICIDMLITVGANVTPPICQSVRMAVWVHLEMLFILGCARQNILVGSLGFQVVWSTLQKWNISQTHERWTYPTAVSRDMAWTTWILQKQVTLFANEMNICLEHLFTECCRWKRCQISLWRSPQLKCL